MTKKIILGLALVASTAAYAQDVQTTTTTAPVTGGGLLGQRYGSVGFGHVDVNHSSIGQFGAGVAVNTPVANNIDVNLAYTYNWLEGNSDVNGSALDLTGIYYLTEGNLKPFGYASVGYVWPDLGDQLTWGAGAGFEYIFNTKFSTIVSGGYEDDFKDGDNGSFAGSVAGNYWLNNQWALNAEATWYEAGSIGYGVSAIFRF